MIGAMERMPTPVPAEAILLAIALFFLNYIGTTIMDGSQMRPIPTPYTEVQIVRV